MNCVVDSVVLDDFKMQYIKFGKGSKALVILPGLSIQSVINAAPAIKKQYEIFCKDFTVYIFDRRCDLPDIYSVYDMADDTAKAMSALGLSRVCLFGVSQGGMIAETIAIKYPELVEKSVLGSTACRMDAKRFSVISDWIKLAKEGNAQELYLSFGEKVYNSETFIKYCSSFISMSKSVTKAELERFVILAEGADDFDVKDRLGEIRCPVLVIGDSDDAVLGDAAAEIADAMKNNPDFQIYMYSGYGHAVYDLAPDYPKRLFDFFK
ncbi:MAG: alpha/beta hydrolase [Clostridia bacterium]|nr:alpha/beta hydrolase [Clostridia bacterium]